MNSLVSICIPTFRRPEFLSAALESCAAQTYGSFEVVIGDDSPDDTSEQVVDRFRNRREWTISYRRHTPSLGQNANVSDLFRRAQGDRIVLLHDDDRLLPNALEDLSAPWAAFPDLALTFGRQEIITQSGDVDDDATEEHNTYFNRVGATGPKPNSIAVALRLQIPNNGYMIRTDVARKVNYRSDDSVGVYCDTDFAIRLGANLGANQMYFIDKLVSQYRLSDESISKSTNSRRSAHARAAVSIYEYVDSLPIARSSSTEMEFFRRHLIDKLVKGYAIAGRRKAALKFLLSGTYGWKRRTSRRGLYHLMLICEPRLDRFRPYS